LAKPVIDLPFRATQSEQRIILDLLQTGKLRWGFEWQSLRTDHTSLAEKQISDAAGLIRSLQTELFPEEARLKAARAKNLASLTNDKTKVIFDESLESDSIEIHARLTSGEDLQRLLKALSAFDFAQWQHQCETERMDAD
jgi:hypothetical protein